MSRRSRLLVSALAVLLPPTALAAMLALWGVDLPYWDQFAFVTRLADQAAGQFQLGDLWTPHNEHRLVVPQAVMMVLASASGWNVLWELWFQFGLVLLALAIVVALLAGPEEPAETSVTVLLVMSLLLFSPVQWRNWLWGWQIQIFLVVLAALGTVWLLVRVRRPWLRLGSAALAATVGSLSFANGLLLWPLAAPLVALGGSRDDDAPVARRQLATWIALGALVWMAYFFGFLPGVDHGPTDQGLWRRMLYFGAYVVLYLAAPLLLRCPDRVALWGGLVVVAVALAGLAIAAWRALRQRDAEAMRRGLPWWTLSGFAVASACVTALGRLDLGIGQALAPRYVTIANLFWLGLVGWLATRRADAAAGRPKAAKVVAAAMLALLVANGVYGAGHFQRDSQERRDLRRQILAARSPEELRALPLESIFPSNEEAARRLETLRDLRLAIYRDRQ